MQLRGMALLALLATAITADLTACSDPESSASNPPSGVSTGGSPVLPMGGSDQPAAASGSGGTNGTVPAGTGGQSSAGVAGGNGIPPAGTTGAGQGGNAAAGNSAGAGGAGQSGMGAGAGGAGQSGMGGAGSGAAGAGQGGGGQAGSAAGTGGSGGSGGSAAPRKKFVGNITTRGQVRSDFARYWNQITPENEGKWGTVEPTRDVMKWEGLDRIYAYAKANNLLFKQHTFVWGSQQPGWIASLPAAEQRAEVEEWIRLFCERYPDVALIDVVNEPPPHTTPSYMAALGGKGSSGYDWIVQSFKWARQYCPKAILILNDYNNIEWPDDNTRFLDIVAKLKAAGAPIDAIGAQAHDVFMRPDATVKGFIDKLTATGLPLYITEYDLNIASDTEQRTVLSRQFPMFWNNDRIHGITLWGYVSGATWKTNTGLMSESGTERPALTWLVEFLK